MFILAITGDFNAGKSTVRRFLERHGWNGIDCDAIVHVLYKPHAQGSLLIKKICGTGVFFHNGQLHRAALGRLLTRHPLLRRKVERAIHPLVRRAVLHQLSVFRKQDVQMVCIEIPVYDAGFLGSMINGLLWVTAPRVLVQRRLPLRKKYLHPFLRVKKPLKTVFMVCNDGLRAHLYGQIRNALVHFPVLG